MDLSTWSASVICLILICSINFYVAGDLHHKLTKRELLGIFGSTSHNDVPKYEIAFIRSHTVNKRSVVPNDVFYRLHLNGENLTLHLYPNTQLISPHFELKPEGLNVNITAATECLYHGRILQSPHGRAAVSVCDGQGLTGLIETSDGRYQIQPAPARFQESVTEQGNMHILVPKNETGTFCGVHELNKPQKLVAGTTYAHEPVLLQSSRNRRSDPVVDKLYIETAVFADYMLYRTLVGRTLLADHDAFVKYVLAIVNTVQLIYNEPSLGRTVEIVLVRLEILQNEHLPFYNEEVDKYLWDFCKWQSGLNPGTDLSTPGHWDHAIILTGFDLRSGNMRSVTGYAPVGGMCNPMYSCTINEGNHFGAAFVIAHEMGHSLTMQHDGQAGVSGNGCDAQSYLMSPSTGRGKTTWSTCSRNYLDAFLMSSQSTCLKDVPPGRESAIDFYSGNLPGQLYPPDDQCRLLYGIEFHRYNMQPDADVCEILICANSTVYITGHPALPGTYCGAGHWCSGGECVPWGVMGPIPVDGGWSAWPSSAECSANCILPGTGVRIFDRSCTNPMPSNGGKACEGKSKRYRTCDQASLCDKLNISTISEYSNRQCASTKTAQNDITLAGSGRQRIQDPTGGCVVWCDTLQGGYKTWGAKFPDGTDCSGGNGKAFCLDGHCQAFGCDGWTLDESSLASCQSFTTTASTTTTVSTTPTYVLVNGEDTSNGINTNTPVTLPTKTLLFPDQNPFYAMVDQSWGGWENVGPCIASCIQNSTGIRRLNRKCVDPAGICIGRNTSIAKCSTTCPKVSYSAEAYVTKICSALKTLDHGLTGRGKQLPHSSSDNRQSCKLWCEKENTLRSWPDMYFPDGTRCNADSTFGAYCYKGVCTDFACDGVAADPNDAPKCADTKGILADESSGHKRKVNHTVDKSPLVAIEQPQSGTIPSANNDSSHFQWVIMSSACSKSCDGGTRKNFVHCTKNASSSKGGQKIEESNCDSETRPVVALEEACNTEPCPLWSASNWKECSVQCGNGTQTRLVQCVRTAAPIGNVTVESILEDAHCDRLAKPVVTQTCTRPPCSVAGMVSGVN
ncbi:A disintegrin and metalloproteinase with thrombospondin motifs 18-like [Paramacrobiotus metropolitanus]|uniref:A disintegrin and metalloproteinase with thrombospondin motifs 18-like n=1 Tax=Paramacrobiotus metropolitanus TaxID=2943436 RepID=UPI00244582AD|nr:A disintegrin and metalloproteinase with thrombospondin motifs 18-like [Paramacrobiotus metropolitanus]